MRTKKPSIFERAKQRIFQRRKLEEVQMQGDTPASRPTASPAAASGAASRGRAASTASLAIPTQAGRQIKRSEYDSMTISERRELKDSGGATVVEDSVTEQSRAMELEFPYPLKSSRTWENFMAFSDTQVQDFTARCGDRKAGADDRQEIFDAVRSMDLHSWRNPEKKLLNAERREFIKKWNKALGFVAEYGPDTPSPNDPAPKPSANDMKAAGFMSLGEKQTAEMNKLMAQEVPGRNARAELKRAYRAATSAERLILYSSFRAPLTSFPKERV